MTGNNRRSAIEDLILVVQIIRLHQGQGEEDIQGQFHPEVGDTGKGLAQRLLMALGVLAEAQLAVVVLAGAEAEAGVWNLTRGEPLVTSWLLSIFY